MRLRLWWIPQVPMADPFHVDVQNVGEAILLYETLARYDAYQFERRIKPDYCNVGGLEEWDDEDEEWFEWHNDEGYDISEVINNVAERVAEMEAKVMAVTDRAARIKGGEDND